jgi:hypothetical protein
MMRTTALRLQPLLRRPLAAATAIRSPALLRCSPARRFATLPADESERSSSGVADLDRNSTRLSKAPTQGIPPSPFDREVSGGEERRGIGRMGQACPDAASRMQLGNSKRAAHRSLPPSSALVCVLVCQPVHDSGDAASGVKEQLGKLSEKAKSIGRKTKRTLVSLANVRRLKGSTSSAVLHAWRKSERERDRLSDLFVCLH